MPHGFAIELLGLRLGFSASPGRAADLLDRYVFPGLPRNPLSLADTAFELEEVAGGFRICQDAAEYARTNGDDEAGANEAVVLLQQAVDQHVVHHAPGFAFVHCGVVGAGGAAALVIADSGHGKSTLVEELVGSAWRADYYSDEYAAIDAAGRVHAYPRALLIRAGRRRQHPVAPQELGARVAAGPAEIRVVLELPYAAEDGPAGVRLTALEQSEALHLLLQSTPQAL